MTALVLGRRLLVAVTGAGLVLTGTPVPAGAAGRDPGGADVEAEERAALTLLDEAAVAARSLTYSGTQYLASWRGAGTTSTLVEIAHEPSAGSRVTVVPAAESAEGFEAVAAVAWLDQRMVGLLDHQYDLRVAGSGQCTGRVADVVEARRAGRWGAAGLAGRFWVDRDSGLVLRREVLDERGRRVRSTAFVDLVVTSGPAPSGPAVGGPALGAAGPGAVPRPAVDADSDAGAAAPAATVGPPRRNLGERLGRSGLAQLRRDGWLVPERLPGRLRLFDARLRHPPGGSGDPVVHLAYSDGLSTTSLFVQRGALGAEPPDGFAVRQVDGATVWVRTGTPERVVWGGGGRVWTLVSDAPTSAVTAAIAQLPHEEPPSDGMLARLSRGAARLAGMVNPFS